MPSLYDSDFEVLNQAIAWLESGQRVALATVVRTFGSSPRPTGAHMALASDGRFAGSVSGGCIEDDLIERMRGGELGRDRPQIYTYGITRQSAARYRLPCGGQVEIAVERIASVDALQPIVRTIAERQLIKRVLHLSTGNVSLQETEPGNVLRYDGQQIAKIYGPVYRLLIIGAGDLARYLAQMALALGYEVLVCDPRPEYMRGWEIAYTRLLTQMPDDAVRAEVRDARCAVIATTHDPRLDDLGLLEALNSAAFYVGALGSRATNQKRRERLAELGLDAAAIARLHGPVGLPIGSRTPAEIAVSILAHIIAVQRFLTSHAVSALTSIQDGE